MRINTPLLWAFVWLLVTCGKTAPQNSDHRISSDLTIQDANSIIKDSNLSEKLVHLRKNGNEQVMHSMVIPFSTAQRTNLAATTDVSTWTVDMEEKVLISSDVAPDKYLRIRGQLNIPTKAQNSVYDIGCLFVELKDNVYFKEKTWLRFATSGITGKKYEDVKVPIRVKMTNWQEVPILNESITLSQFDSSTIKRFNSSLCFQMDFTNAPAQTYEGALVFQYLRPGNTNDPRSCTTRPNDADCLPSPNGDPTTQDDTTAPHPFTCTSTSVALKSNQETTLTWSINSQMLSNLKLSAVKPLNLTDLGSVQKTSSGTILYKAPTHVAQNSTVSVSAQPGQIDAFPAFCQIQLVGDNDLGVPDDGETIGLRGNIYQLTSSVANLPNYSTMTPIDHIVTSNLDVPDRAWTTGFPGVRNLVEWFGIRFEGTLMSATAQTCQFELLSDDGANLYIDGIKVIDNDGWHPPTSAYGTAQLAAGDQAIRVDYFQGPRTQIALQLFWKCGSQSEFKIVPPSAFKRPLQ